MAASILVAPSALSADFTRLGEEVRAVDAAAIFGAKDYKAAIGAIRASAAAGATRS